jgi:Tfp pilus assembly protein PilF
MRISRGSHLAAAALYLLCIAASAQKAATPPDAKIQAAVALMQTGDFAAGAKVLEDLLQSEPRKWPGLAQSWNG